MIKSVEGDFDNSKGEVNDMASGIFNTALGCGQVSGPIYGSMVNHALGFRRITSPTLITTKQVGVLEVPHVLL
jgi:hypothetical protein